MKTLEELIQDIKKDLRRPLTTIELSILRISFDTGDMNGFEKGYKKATDDGMKALKKGFILKRKL